MQKKKKNHPCQFKLLSCISSSLCATYLETVPDTETHAQYQYHILSSYFFILLSYHILFQISLNGKPSAQHQMWNWHLWQTFVGHWTQRKTNFSSFLICRLDSIITILILCPCQSKLFFSGHGIAASLSSEEVKGWLNVVCWWVGLCFKSPLLWWERVLPDKKRGYEVDVGGAICCLIAREVGGWDKQQPLLQCLADELILLHINANQWGVKKLRGRHIDNYKPRQRGGDEGEGEGRLNQGCETHCLHRHKEFTIDKSKNPTTHEYRSH